MIPWVQSEPWPPLERDHVHLWWVSLDVAERRRQKLFLSLSSRERKRAARFKFCTPRHRYVVGRGIARELLGRYLDEIPSSIRFQFGPYGKPSLADTSHNHELCFNYTDSQGRALYAFARGCELGVDLEHLARTIRYRRIVARKFTPSEGAALLKLPDAEGKRAFLGCWTRKEAYGKAKGVGICYPLDSVDLCSDYESPVMTIRDRASTDAVRSWNLIQFNPDAHFVASIVYAGAGRRLQYFRYSS